VLTGIWPATTGRLRRLRREQQSGGVVAGAGPGNVLERLYHSEWYWPAGPARVCMYVIVIWSRGSACSATILESTADGACVEAGGRLMVDRCRFEANYAYFDGGGLCALQAEAFVSHGVFAGNTPVPRGGFYSKLRRTGGLELPVQRNAPTRAVGPIALSQPTRRSSTARFTPTTPSWTRGLVCQLGQMKLTNNILWDKTTPAERVKPPSSATTAELLIVWSTAACKGGPGLGGEQSFGDDPASPNRTGPTASRAPRTMNCTSPAIRHAWIPAMALP